MSKLTIIQLLNKIANGEEVPKKIRYGDLVYNWTGLNYYNLTDTYLDSHICIEDLEQEVEVIEYNKKIEKLDKLDKCDKMQSFSLIDPTMNEKILGSKINEIIEVLNDKD